MSEHKNVNIQTVTFRPVWPAVSALDFYYNVYLQVKMAYYTSTLSDEDGGFSDSHNHRRVKK